MLQMILHCPSFMANLKSYCATDYHLIVKTPSGDIPLVLRSTDVSAVERELIRIWETDSASMSPAGLRNELLKNEQFRLHFNGFHEQDSHEAFLMTLHIVREAQIARVRKAIMDHFHCRHDTTNLNEASRAQLKSLGTLAGKMTLLHAHFGMVVGCALQCDDCRDIRVRFDECVHIAPIFATVATVTNDDTCDNEAAVKPSKTAPNVSKGTHVDDTTSGKKLSKHQQKKQKRVERKTNRNKKSTQRNIECTANGAAETEAEAMLQSDGPAAPINDDTETAVDDDGDDVALLRPLNPLMERFLLGSEGEADVHIDGGVDDGDDGFDIVATVPRSSSCSNAALGSASSRSSMSSRGALSMMMDDIDVNNNNNDNDEDEAAAVEDQNYDDDEEIDVVERFTRNLSIDDGRDSIAMATVMDAVNGGDITCSPMQSSLSSSSDAVIIDPCDCSSITGNGPPMMDSHCQSVNSHINGDSAMQEVLTAALVSHQSHISVNNGLYVDDWQAGTDLDRALRKFTAPLHIDNLVCDSCVSAARRSTCAHLKMDIICHAPLVLPIYISRFKQMSAKNRSAKNNQLYSYPFLLDLSSQCSQYANVGGDLSPVIYRLYGIIEHIGARINSGHYVSYVSQHRQSADSVDRKLMPQSYSSSVIGDICDKHRQQLHGDRCDLNGDVDVEGDDTPITIHDYNWFRISDSHVEAVSTGAVLSCQAFMLFYIRLR